ncbi:MAG: response regulator [Anaerolineae bacterium]|nr:response regulator [Anaerolineae bacterium]
MKKESQGTQEQIITSGITKLEQEQDIHGLIALLPEMFTSFEQSLRIQVYEALLRTGTDAVTNLVTFLALTDEDTLTITLRAIAQAGTPSLPLMENIFHQSDHRVRQAIAKTLFQHSVPVTAPSPDDFLVQGAALLKRLGIPRELRNILILYIEDDDLNRDYFRRSLYLSHANYILLETPDGTSGLNIALEIVPDIIVMDINLPGLDSYDVVHELKCREETKGIVVVACTAAITYNDQKRAFDAGCDGFIEKPIDIDLLPKQINRYLEGDKW